MATPGFTFVEMLVILVIIGLLAAFGLPALLKYGMQNRLATAQAVLQQIAGQQSEWYAQHRVYAGLNQLGYPVDSAVAAIYLAKDGSISGHASANCDAAIERKFEGIGEKIQHDLLPHVAVHQHGF